MTDMNRPVSLVMASLTAVLVAAPPVAAAERTSSAITWQTCRTYSDEALAAMVPPDRLELFRQMLTRQECGTVSVPLDYRRPQGRTITVALTRIKAADREHRLGSLALNPGGPGGSGYLLPVQLLTEGGAADLNDRYDLIGFDPRGVGYSTKRDCTPPAGEEPETTGPITEAAARQRFAAESQALADCGNADPAFLGGLTTANVARDMDRIRAGLGDRKLGFLGVSWGTWLGVVYRDLFPERVSRMFLDSVAIPDFDMVTFQDERAAAGERDARRMTAWMAERDDEYGLGGTAAQVTATVVALRDDYDAHPRRFTDLPIPLDGEFVAVAMAQDSQVWPLAARVLKELREATGTTAPPTVKEVIGDPSDSGEPPADLPERGNRTMNRAAFCNEDPSRLGFDDAWDEHLRLLADNPLTGRALGFSAGCAGWPLPVQPVTLHRTTAPVVLSGHRWESPSPYEWTGQTRAAVGGKVYTVDDDVHGSVLSVPECIADVVGYFATGAIDGGCPGKPVPTGDAPAAETFTAPAPEILDNTIRSISLYG